MTRVRSRSPSNSPKFAASDACDENVQRTPAACSAFA